MRIRIRSFFHGVALSSWRVLRPGREDRAKRPALPIDALGPDRLARISNAFDDAWYLGDNDDVRAAGSDPFAHYLNHGRFEGRNPSPYFEADWYRDMYLANSTPTGGSAECPLIHYTEQGSRAGNRPHPLIDPSHVERRHGVAPQDLMSALVSGEPYIDEFCEWFSRSAYLEAHPDLAGMGVVAPHHFLWHGISEGRPPTPGYRLTEEAAMPARRRHELTAAREPLLWKGKLYVIERTAVPDAVVKQILAQGVFDPRIFAPGRRAIANLVQTRAPDIEARAGFNHRRLLDAIAARPDVVVVHSGVCVGGSEAYMEGMVRALTRDLGLRPLVLTTGATAAEDRAGLKFEGLNALRLTQILSIGPELRAAHEPATMLALFLLVMAPKHLFVVNSRTGFEALRRHGRALAAVSRIYVPFFSEAADAAGPPYSTRYLFDVIERVRVFADSQRVLDTLSGRLAHQHSDRFVLLPQSVAIPASAAFEAALAGRLARRGRERPRVCWLSRWNTFKATDVVIELARRWPELHIDIFGAPDNIHDFPRLPGLHRHGMVRPAAPALEIYDAYVFTSQFGDMPNDVLEMAALGVPCICSDVGGLREVFDETCIDFVGNEKYAVNTATSFETALRRTLGRSDADTGERVRRAHRAVAARCSEEAFARALGGMLEVPVPGHECPGATA